MSYGFLRYKTILKEKKRLSPPLKWFYACLSCKRAKPWKLQVLDNETETLANIVLEVACLSVYARPDDQSSLIPHSISKSRVRIELAEQ